MEDQKREKVVVGVHHKLEIESRRATSGETVCSFQYTSLSLSLYPQIFPVALILLLVDPFDGVLMALMAIP